jgi:signal transduction histidine kinase
MNSLRIRIAFVLVISIVAVVGLATSATIFIIGPRGPEIFTEPTALQIRMLVPIFESLQSSTSRPVGLSDAPTEGAQREMTTGILQNSLRAKGLDNRVVVTKPMDRDSATVSVELSSHRWFQLPIPDEPRFGVPWFALGSWLSLIVGGAVAIALAVANRLARPLALLESVASTISRSGQMAVLPETGPGEVKATARALNRLTANLKAAMESRMRLVAAAGHDLRTPITRMRIRAEFLPEQEQSAWLRDLDELRRIADSSIQLVHEEVERRIDEAVRFDKLAGSVVEELTAAGLPVELVGSMPVLIRAAPLAITRVLRNVLTNAATHGKSCKVCVEARQDFAVVLVEDTGPGIPAEVIDRVFEPFFRIDPARQQPIPGAGLGLAIAKEIVERHGGEIFLNNKPSGGLRQEIRFPRHVEQQSQGGRSLVRRHSVLADALVEAVGNPGDVGLKRPGSDTGR